MKILRPREFITKSLFLPWGRNGECFVSHIPTYDRSVRIVAIDLSQIEYLKGILMIDVNGKHLLSIGD